MATKRSGGNKMIENLGDIQLILDDVPERPELKIKIIFKKSNEYKI